MRPATQTMELAAKARLVPLVLNGSGTISDEVQAFVLRFADDVLALAEAPSMPMNGLDHAARSALQSVHSHTFRG